MTIQLIQHGARCNECGGQLIPGRSGFTCTACGLVHDPLFQSSNTIIEELRVGSNPIRETGKQFSAPESPLIKGTFMGYFTEVFSFKVKHGRMFSARFTWLKKRDSTLKIDPAYHSRASIFEAASFLDLPRQTTSRALYLFNRILKVKRRVPNRVMLAMSCIYVAIREHSIIVNPAEIEEAFRANNHRVKYKAMLPYMRAIHEVTNIRMHVVRPIDHVARMITAISNDESIHSILNARGLEPGTFYDELRANVIPCINETFKYVQNRRPSNVVAAAIYHVINDMARARVGTRLFSQEIIARALGVKEYSLRDVYQSFKDPRRRQSRGGLNASC